MPFCGDRCRLVDLNRWLSEDYPFPTTRRNEDEDDGEPRAVNDETEA